MERKELIQALKHLKVETGSLACLGCGYEHSCSTKGCAILREAADDLEEIEAALDELKQRIKEQKTKE